MRIWRGPRGIEVEVVVLGRRARYRVVQVNRHGRFLLGYYDTIREIARHVDLADLVELISFPGPSSGVAGADS